MGLSHIYGIIVGPPSLRLQATFHSYEDSMGTDPTIAGVPLDQKRLGVKRRPMRTGIKVDDDDLPIVESEIILAALAPSDTILALKRNQLVVLNREFVSHLSHYHLPSARSESTPLRRIRRECFPDNLVHNLVSMRRSRPRIKGYLFIERRR